MVKKTEKTDEDIVLAAQETGIAANFISLEKELQYLELLKTVLPQVAKDERKIIITEVLLALKMEGIIGEELSDQDINLIKTIKDAVFLTPEIKQDALQMANLLLEKEIS